MALDLNEVRRVFAEYLDSNEDLTVAYQKSEKVFVIDGEKPYYHANRLRLASGKKPIRIMLDSVQSLDGVNEDGYVGRIFKDGTLVGRVDIGEDGKAMVFVGGSGDVRVKFKSGVVAGYSDDDAAEMVESLLTFAQEATAVNEEGEADTRFKSKYGTTVAQAEAIGLISRKWSKSAGRVLWYAEDAAATPFNTAGDALEHYFTVVKPAIDARVKQEDDDGFMAATTSAIEGKSIAVAKVGETFYMVNPKTGEIQTGNATMRSKWFAAEDEFGIEPMQVGSAENINKVSNAIKASAMNEETSKKYLYGMAYRPFSLGAQPKGQTAVYEDRKGDGYRFGMVEYDRPLTAEEVSSFELVTIMDDERMAGLVDTVAADMAKYAAGYVEQATDEPEAFASRVRDGIKKAYPSGAACHECSRLGTSEDFANAVKEKLAAMSNTSSSNIGDVKFIDKMIELSKVEVMQMALDALDDSMRIMHTHGVAFGSSTIHARKALEAELAKPEPKPIALVKLVKNGLIQGCECLADAQVAEYTRPGWVPLYRKGDL